MFFLSQVMNRDWRYLPIFDFEPFSGHRRGNSVYICFSAPVSRYNRLGIFIVCCRLSKMLIP